MKKVLRIETRVIGKTKANNGKKGTITAVETVGTRRKFRVEWDRGGNELCSSNSLELEGVSVPSTQQITQKRARLDEDTSSEFELEDGSEEDNEHEEEDDSNDDLDGFVYTYNENSSIHIS